VCAIGVCFTHGEECTRCHGRNTLPGVRLGCRGSRGEAIAYAAALALWQRRLVAQADAIVVPSMFALRRLHELGAPVGAARVIAPVVRDHAEPHPGSYALVTSRLAPEKGIEVAIEASRIAGMPLVVAGDGPDRARLEAMAPAVRFTGAVGRDELARLRHEAAVALVPSRSPETFGLAAAEAMAAGLPVAASAIGALPELVPSEWLAPPNDAVGLAAAIQRIIADPESGATAVGRARARCAPEVIAPQLAAVYA
jgi:glycosyltransferase involved in cell wall biosynthesis